MTEPRELLCEICGREHRPWAAASPLWNAVVRGGSIDGHEEYEFLCANCFMELAEDRGIASLFRLTAAKSIELETVTPSGRVWSDRHFLWMPPKIERFLANPPARIGADAVKKRKDRAVHSYGNWRGELFKRQKGRCKYCKCAMDRSSATVDHVVPLSQGGRNSRSNVVLACRACNAAKGSMSAADFMASMNKPQKVGAGAALKRGWR
jgi:hypothetical protein